MDLLFGVGLLVIVLALFTLFTYKAPYGAKAMGGFADAACATLLVEAFLSSFAGNVFGIDFLTTIGDAAGSMGGAATAALVAMAIGATPGYAMLCGAAVYGMGIIPGLVVGYLCGFVIKYLQNKLPAGLDLLSMIIIVAPLARFLGMLSEPVVEATLQQIGNTITASAQSNPVVMGAVIGGIMAVVGSSPISSMAISAMLGLVAAPMGVTTMAIWGSSWLNMVLFDRLKFGTQRETLAVFIEPKTQVDLISANPIIIYGANFVEGALCGIFIAMLGLQNFASSTATPFAGLAVMFAYNPAMRVVIAAVGCVLIAVVVGFVFSLLFKGRKITTADDLQKAESKQASRVATEQAS
ncbi:MAG: PTS sugar transporter subunit IIC [Aerococcus sp.]|nr:PTS sugar transporter subunit IIC [Aerococcus sp.]